jgi:tetratricopeptide (TPR) repeat protein
MGKTDEARGDLDHIMVLKPNETAPIIMTGNFLYDSGQYRESITYFDKALLINPNDAHTWVRKGDAYLALSIVEMKKMRGKYRSLTSGNLNYPASSDDSQLDPSSYMESQKEASNAYTQAVKLNPLLYVEVSGSILASTGALVSTYQGILDDLGMDNST